MSTEVFQGLSFIEIVEKLQDDKSFSNLFEAFALNAAVAGLDSPAGEVLLRFFARNEEELAQLVSHGDILQQVLTVNRRDTAATTTPNTAGITTTNSTVQCEATGFARVGFAKLIESNENASQPAAPEPK